MAALIGWASPAPALQNPAEAAFTLRMAERLRNVFPDRPVEISGPLELRLGDGDETSTINLGRPFAACADISPEECDAFADRFFSVLGETPDMAGAIRAEQLRVMIRHTEYCDEIGRMGGGQGEAQFVFRPFAPELCALLVADYPDAMRTLTDADLGTLGLAADAAWAQGERQTLANLPRPEDLDLDDDLVVVSDLDYVPSLMLNLDGWRRANAAAGGDIVVVVPADGFLAAGRLARLGNLDGFRTVTVDAYQSAERGISPLVYRLTEAGWAALD